ncbi:hypothetical protein NLJ89_g8350 [Agrocybe chaxingu]|uniref:Cyclin-domain-containing protein n=1 Tax=Agrocybe chaxingu TaxID=84603 RepID=A0A9W8MSU4_9AGAR|nr:hypothetical protein NLJ89_g8350 [Agrocybe chaxingu]
MGLQICQTWGKAGITPSIKPSMATPRCLPAVGPPKLKDRTEYPRRLRRLEFAKISTIRALYAPLPHQHRSIMLAVKTNHALIDTSRPTAFSVHEQPICSSGFDLFAPQVGSKHTILESPSHRRRSEADVSSATTPHRALLPSSPQPVILQAPTHRPPSNPVPQMSPREAPPAHNVYPHASSSAPPPPNPSNPPKRSDPLLYPSDPISVWNLAVKNVREAMNNMSQDYVKLVTAERAKNTHLMQALAETESKLTAALDEAKTLRQEKQEFVQNLNRARSIMGGYKGLWGIRTPSRPPSSATPTPSAPPPELYIPLPFTSKCPHTPAAAPARSARVSSKRRRRRISSMAEPAFEMRGKSSIRGYQFIWALSRPLADDSIDAPPIWHSLTTASRGAISTPAATLTFHARNIPTISLEAYLLRILKYCPTSNHVFLSLLVYFDRMSKLSQEAVGRPFVIDSYNIHRLVIAGVTVASKFFSDVFYTNSRYAKVGGLPLPELNQLELQFLLLNDFRLVVVDGVFPPSDEWAYGYGGAGVETDSGSGGGG